MQVLIQVINGVNLALTKFQKKNRQQKKPIICQPGFCRTSRKPEWVDFGGAIAKSNLLIEFVRDIS